MKKLLILCALFCLISFSLSNIYAQQSCPNVADYSYMPPSIKTNQYVNIMYLLDIGKSMVNYNAYINDKTGAQIPVVGDITDILTGNIYNGYFIPKDIYCYDYIFNGSSFNLMDNNGDRIFDNLTDNISFSDPVKPLYYYKCTDILKEALNSSGSGISIDLGSLTSIITQIIPMLIDVASGALTLNLTVILDILQPLLGIINVNINIPVEKIFDLLMASLGNALNYTTTTRADLVHMLLTGGRKDTIERCVQISDCYSHSTIFGLTGQECPTDYCLEVPIGQIVSIASTAGVAVIDALLASGTLVSLGTLGPILIALLPVVSALLPIISTLLGNASLCLPDPLSNLDCYSQPTPDDCAAAGGDNATMCEWQTRDVILAKNGSYGVEWTSSSTYVPERDCVFKGSILDGVFDNGTRTRGCLEGLIDKMYTWTSDTPRIGSTIYSSLDATTEDNVSTLESKEGYEKINDFIDKNYIVSGLLEGVNSAQKPEDIIKGLPDEAATDKAVNLAKVPLFDANAYNFDIAGTTKTVPCTKNLFFYLSDGLWTDTDPVGSFHNVWLGGEYDNITDIAGKQNIETYAFNMDLTENKTVECVNSMQNTAVFGGYRDYDNNGWPCGYDNGSYPDTSQTEAIHKSCYEWDGNLDGTPDNYFVYNKLDQFVSVTKGIFEMAVEGALEQTYNSTAPAIARYNKDEIGLWVNAFYFPKMIFENTSADWRGDVQAYFLDKNNSIRENDDNSSDTVDNLPADIGDSYKIFTYYDDNKTYTDNLLNFITSSADNKSSQDNESFYSIIALNYGDTYDNLTPVDCNPDNKTLSGNVYPKTLPVWSALFDNVTYPSDSRVIFYNDNTTNNSIISNNFDNTTNTVDTLSGMWCGTNNESIRKIIDEIRSGKNGYLYGDIVNSKPVIVPHTSINNYHNKYNDLSYYDYTNSDIVRKRPTTVIAGSNDGMVHAFYAGEPKTLKIEGQEYKGVYSNKDYNYKLGQELWAFIPYNALPYLQWSNIEGPKYHIPKINYNFTLIDASIGEQGNANAGDDRTADSWRTLLVGTMGFGGKKMEVNNGTDNKTYSSSIFVLDVTNTVLNNGEQNNNKPTFMWEAQLPDNTLALSQPTVIKLGEKQKNGDWYVVVGSGPNDPKADNFTESPKLYFFNLKNGELENTIDMDSYSQYKAIGEIMEVDSNNDYADDALFFGTYDNETGSLYAATINGDISSTEIQSLTGRTTGNSFEAPYFAKPTNTFDEKNNVWVYAASGRLFSDDDMKPIVSENSIQDNSTKQYILGLKFTSGNTDNTNNSNVITINSISSMNLYNATGKKVDVYIDNISCYCAGVYLGPADQNSECGSYKCCQNNNKEYGCQKALKLADNSTLPDEGDVSVQEFARDNFLSSDAQYSGWYIELSAASGNASTNDTSYERAYAAPSVGGGLVNASTYTPISSPCSVKGTTKLYSLYYLTGTPSGQLIFMSDNADIDNILESTNNVNAGNTETMSGSTLVGNSGVSLPPPTGQAMTSVPGNNGKLTTFIGSSRVEQQTPEPANGITSKIILKKVR